MSKYVWWGVGALGAALGMGYLWRLSNLATELETSISAEIYKVDLSAITVRFYATLKNPTKGTLSVKHPFVKFIYKGETLFSSDIVDKDYQIPQYGTLKLDGIYLKVGLMTLASKFPALLKEYRSKGSLTLTAETITIIGGAKQYKSTQDITIGKSGEQG